MRGPNNNSRLAWLLPLIVIRALVPVGFMPAWEHGALRMVLCEPDGLMAAAGQPPHHHHHAGAPADRPSHHHAHGECPFGQSTGPALLPALTPLATAYTVIALHPAAVTSVADRRIPPRYQAPRGPPAVLIVAI
jgi:hypothetical protein